MNAPFGSIYWTLVNRWHVKYSEIKLLKYLHMLSIKSMHVQKCVRKKAYIENESTICETPEALAEILRAPF